MINAGFWKTIKDKWIRNEDPTVTATEGLIQKDKRTSQEINNLNKMLNGNITDFSSTASLDDINSMMEQLNDLGIDEVPFDALFSDIGNEDDV